MQRPPLGILLDVDGPVADPSTRTVAAKLLADVLSLLAAGVPVVLNTGRSVDYVREHVLAPLTERGLPPGSRLHAVCEKGAVWTSPADGGVVHEDAALRVPDAGRDLLEALVRDGYGETMFVDRTKRVMVTAEARTDLPDRAFPARQEAFAADLLAGLRAAGLGVRLRDQRWPDADGRCPWRIDPSVIATDLESDDSGKALGAHRALRLLADDGPLPHTWHTVGDSRSDYAMADHLHEAGYDVTHVDVGPRPALTDRPYVVESLDGLAYVAAGGAHLRALADRWAG